MKSNTVSKVTSKGSAAFAVPAMRPMAKLTTSFPAKTYRGKKQEQQNADHD